MIDLRAIRRLEAMDIQVWQTREPRQTRADELRADRAAPVENHCAQAACDSSRPSARIRLEAGSGRWLLVIDDADRARHATLIEDIRATLGIGDCRFGTWSDSVEAGVAVEDWDAHGIRRALIFGGEPDRRGTGPRLVHGGDLERLATSGQARRALWGRLKPLLAA